MARFTLLTMTSSGTERTMGEKFKMPPMPAFDEQVGHFLRGGGRHGENGHLDAVLPDEVAQFVHAVQSAA